MFPGQECFTRKDTDMIEPQKLIRIGIVFDGGYFFRISSYYNYEHARGARIDILGLNNVIRHMVADRENADPKTCHIIESHYFSGRWPADEAEKRNNLLGDRKFEDVLIRAGVTSHFLLLKPHKDEGATGREKGVDVWLALEAYELASVKHCNVIVLISGDGDQVQLVRKLNSLGARVMVLAWDLNLANGEKIRTSQALIDAVTYPIEMAPLIESRGRDPLIDGLFLPQSTKPDDRKPLQPVDRTEGTVQSGTIDNVQSEVPNPYGFITPENGGDNIHFLFSATVGDWPGDPQAKMRVCYMPTINPRTGQLTAREVEFLDPDD